MQPSLVQTLSIPGIGTPSPSRLIQAGPVPMRVMVRNTGGTLIMIAHEVNALTDLSALGSVYQLPAGSVDVFVLAPMQSLIAASQGGGGQVSIAVSEAVPVKNFYMES